MTLHSLAKRPGLHPVQRHHRQYYMFPLCHSRGMRTLTIPSSFPTVMINLPVTGISSSTLESFQKLDKTPDFLSTDPLSRSPLNSQERLGRASSAKPSPLELVDFDGEIKSSLGMNDNTKLPVKPTGPLVHLNIVRANRCARKHAPIHASITNTRVSTCPENIVSIFSPQFRVIGRQQDFVPLF